MNTTALKETWAAAESLGDDVPLYFYSHLFLTHPELRSMFPVSMATQRDRLVGALGRIVSRVDQLDEVTAFIQQLGRDHRRFEVDRGALRRGRRLAARHAEALPRRRLDRGARRRLGGGVRSHRHRHGAGR